MLSHATCPGGPINLFNMAQQVIELVFGKPSDRIAVSRSRAAVPVGRDVEGAVKRDVPGIRVLTLSFRILLPVCLLALQAGFSLAAQSTSDENKPRD